MENMITNQLLNNKEFLNLLLSRLKRLKVVRLGYIRGSLVFASLNRVTQKNRIFELINDAQFMMIAKIWNIEPEQLFHDIELQGGNGECLALNVRKEDLLRLKALSLDAA
ncbi:hypothetical protein K3G63_06770 [Hymenobacter sp. HSC-4F20]|uniref:hypothetical protein n=1 Tax=Hymenobacter sp. HSC-4F20 TaxID=2864135 RepID=UPI001C72EF44|nr:hypothetical protein [Hymenobacter sp. HSC-4F20]MBX0290134.1 hypothetical protein [Hymenobacter sp. HSC-4F20]